MKMLIAARGTAGHINPALAIAGEIAARCRRRRCILPGRKKGMEYGLVTKAGYPFHSIEVNGIQRRLTPKNTVRNAVALYHLALSAPRAAAILNEVKPDLVIGAGGYVSGPVVQAAQRRGIPTAIHEQNAFPGVTNKILAKHASVGAGRHAGRGTSPGRAGKNSGGGQPSARGDVPRRPCGCAPCAGRTARGR